MIMRTSNRWAALALALSLPAAAAAYAAVPAHVASAVADSHRPEADTKRDAARKPAEVIAFTGVRPGDKVADFVPSSGYFTRIFAKAVGPRGHVYALAPMEWGAEEMDPAKAIAADAAYGNVTAISNPLGKWTVPEKLDVFWTSQNYHDLHNPDPKVDVPAFNKAVFAALKPGGVYIVLDHSAAAGSGLRDANTLHRIDAATVKAEVTAAGFKYVGESKALANSGDPRTAKVFDPAIRGHTDQFIYKFRKPA
jgi:predicted methyltransferase